ncbi:MAG: hypothetical protein AB7G28_20890 [Pirellulales bacterium]
MNQAINPTTRRRCQPRTRRGGGMLDMFVSFTLLIAAMAVATPLVVRHGRLLESQRHYRIALDELTDQLDRLTALPGDELPQAIERLAPSDFARERLAGAEIKGEVTPADGGQRITLRLVWSEPGRHDAPLTLSGWNFSKPNATSDDNRGGQP